MTITKTLGAAVLLFSCWINTVAAAKINVPNRVEGEGIEAPRIILRGGILINGEGAPPRGPVDILIEQGRIKNIRSVGYPGVPIKERSRIKALKGDVEINVEGQYILPGFVDMHGHIGGSTKGVDAEYVFKLWMAHGITTIREPGSFNGLNWTLAHKKLSEQNKIVAPRIVPYVGFGMGHDGPIYSPKQARDWVKSVAEKGAKGIKFFGATPKIMSAALDEAQKQGLKTMMHHAQLDVMRNNVLDTARQGLTTMEHWYGLPEALFEDKVIQHYPANYNYNNEQDRFSEAGKLWSQATSVNSPHWQDVRDELIELDFTINPTMTIYEASRDLMRERQAIWHKEYTLPALWDFFEPSRYAHGSYWFDWTTAEEINWKNNFRKWMTFLNDYKNHGGRVTTGSDSGYIYKIFGFGYVRELELLQEAGFHPLEVIQAATLNGAEALGMDDEIGSIAIGKRADMVITTENPLHNFKVLYGTGHFKLDDNNKPTRVKAVRYTIKDGIVYDAQKLLADVRELVKKAKQEQQAETQK